MKTRYSLIPFLILGLEICWLYALLNAANKSVDDRLAVPLLLLTLPVSWAVSRALCLLRWRKAVLTALSWLAWPVIMLLMLKVQLFSGTAFTDTVWLTSIPQAFSRIFTQFEPALLVLLSTAALWWLGRRLAYLKPGFSSLIADFQFGLIILLIIFFTAYQLNLDQSSSVPVALAFFTLGLLGTAVSHTGEKSRLHNWRQGPWPVIILASIGLILVLGVLISLIFTPDLVQLVWKGIQWVWDIFLRILEFLANLLPHSTETAPAPEMPVMPQTGGEEYTGFHFPDWLQPSLSMVWEIIMGGLVLIAIWRMATMLFGWLRRNLSASGGERESLKDAFKNDFLNFWKRLISRLFRIRSWGTERKGLNAVSLEAASVRQLYSEFLKWAAKAGYPRREAQTPEEYRRELGTVVQEKEADLELITQKYMAARYGGERPTENEVDKLKQTWQNLKKHNFKKRGKA